MSNEGQLMDEGSVAVTTLNEDLVAMATEEFRNETKYVVLNILGLVPPSFELEGSSGEEDSEGGGESQDSENEDGLAKSTCSGESQLQVVGQLELEEPGKEEVEIQTVESDEHDVEGDEKSDQELQDESQSASSVQSQGTPKFLIEEYIDPSGYASQSGSGYGSPSGSGYGSPRGTSKKSQLTRLVMPLREELSHHLDTLDERRGCASPRLWTSSPGVLPPPSPEAMIASRIAAIGDQIMQEHQQRQELNSAVSKLLGLPQSKVTYDIFKEAAKDVIEKEAAPSGWYQIASMLNFSRHVALAWIKKGERRIGQLTDFSVKLIEENMANFIVEQGGWEALYQMHVDDYDLPSSEISDRSFPSSPWPDGFLSVPPRKSSGSEADGENSGFDENSTNVMESPNPDVTTKCVKSDACTQTFEEEYESPETDFDDSDVVAAMFGIQLDSTSESGATGEGEDHQVEKQESGTQTDKAPWFSVRSTAAALALGVSVGIAAMKKS